MSPPTTICVLLLQYLCPHATTFLFTYYHVCVCSHTRIHSYIGGRVLWGFEEAALSFSPTYKFAVDSEEYSGGGKGRVPAWCDRCAYQA
jgi:hypothetical protein